MSVCCTAAHTALLCQADRLSLSTLAVTTRRALRVSHAHRYTLLGGAAGVDLRLLVGRSGAQKESQIQEWPVAAVSATPYKLVQSRADRPVD